MRTFLFTPRFPCVVREELNEVQERISDAVTGLSVLQRVYVNKLRVMADAQAALHACEVCDVSISVDPDPNASAYMLHVALDALSARLCSLRWRNEWSGIEREIRCRGLEIFCRDEAVRTCIPSMCNNIEMFWVLTRLAH